MDSTQTITIRIKKEFISEIEDFQQKHYSGIPFATLLVILMGTGLREEKFWWELRDEYNKLTLPDKTIEKLDILKADCSSLLDDEVLKLTRNILNLTLAELIDRYGSLLGLEQQILIIRRLSAANQKFKASQDANRQQNQSFVAQSPESHIQGKE